MSDLASFVNLYKSQVDKAIEIELGKRLEEANLISPEVVKVIEAMKELSVGGKRMRGLLTILGYVLSHGGGSSEVGGEVVKAAVVMELFHLGLLIQDDVMDRDGLRRGVATIHTRYTDAHLGESIAVLAGDLTFGWGMEQIAKLQAPITNKQKVDAIAVWGKYFARVGYGQMLDISKVAGEKTLLQILNLKSGEYSCVLPLVLGATLGGGSDELIQNLTKYGMELGWVFQLRDDYLAEYGESGKTGKPVGNDSREGKKTLATMYGKTRLEEEIKKHVGLAKNECELLPGDSRKVMEQIVEWASTRDN